MFIYTEHLLPAETEIINEIRFSARGGDERHVNVVRAAINFPFLPLIFPFYSRVAHVQCYLAKLR